MQGLTHFMDDAAVLAAIATLQSIVEAGSSTFAGTVYYVASVGGDDLNDGLTPLDAFATIGAGIAAAVSGDAISVKTGSYDEDGLELALDGVELWGDIGAVLVNTNPGTVLTVSGDYCRVRGFNIAQAGQIGVVVSGAYNVFEGVFVRGCTVGWDINSATNEFIGCAAGNSTVTGFDIGAGSTRLTDCVASGNGAATRGFYLSAGTRNRLVRCITSGNATRGYHIGAASTDNMIMQSVAGLGDGPALDEGLRNSWPYYAQGDERSSHEHMYPPVGGLGVNNPPISMTSECTDDSGAGPWSDQYYWGDTQVIIPVGTNAESWRSLGIYIEATTAADTQPWEIFFTSPKYQSARDGGNDWDYQETVLTVVDGTRFLVGDKVWISGTGATDGEICDVADVTGNVVTITSEARISADTGLKFNYTGAEVMYVVYRETNTNLHGFDGMYSAATTKQSDRMLWETPRRIDQTGGAIMRIYNATDDAASLFDVRMIYQD